MLSPESLGLPSPSSVIFVCDCSWRLLDADAVEYALSTLDEVVVPKSASSIASCIRVAVPDVAAGVFSSEDANGVCRGDAGYGLCVCVRPNIL